MNTFIYRSKFPINKEILFRFHEEPIGFQTLVGGTKGIEIIQPPKSLAIGEEVIFKIRIFPFWKTIWVARHIAYQQNHFFVDCQEKGPFLKFQHTHLFLDGSDGKTLVSFPKKLKSIFISGHYPDFLYSPFYILCFGNDTN